MATCTLHMRIYLNQLSFLCFIPANSQSGQYRIQPKLTNDIQTRKGKYFHHANPKQTVQCIPSSQQTLPKCHLLRTCANTFRTVSKLLLHLHRPKQMHRRNMDQCNSCTSCLLKRECQTVLHSFTSSINYVIVSIRFKSSFLSLHVNNLLHHIPQTNVLPTSDASPTYLSFVSNAVSRERKVNVERRKCTCETEMTFPLSASVFPKPQISYPNKPTAITSIIQNLLNMFYILSCETRATLMHISVRQSKVSCKLQFSCRKNSNSISVGVRCLYSFW